MTVTVTYKTTDATRTDRHERVQAPGFNHQLPGVMFINNPDNTTRAFYTLLNVIKVEQEDSGIVPATVVPGNFGGKVS